MRGKKGAFLMPLVATVAIVAIIAGNIIRTGIQRIDEEPFERHNTNISIPTAGTTLTPTPTSTIELSYAYNNPVVPVGFKHIDGIWETGFTIQDRNENQFVWVPVLDPRVQANGTLDGTNFNSKFGRRKFKNETFNESAFYETNDTVLQNMTESINRYGGFYIAKYEMSNNEKKAQSKADTTPWTNISWYDAKTVAESMDEDWDSSVESYLCYSAHWDSALQWLINSGAKTLSEVSSDSTSWGNYYNTTFTYGTGLIKKTDVFARINTGVNTTPANRHIAKGICDLAGNVWEWTMESYDDSYRVFRGGRYFTYGNYEPAANRNFGGPVYPDPSLGFRCVLHIR